MAKQLCPACGCTIVDEGYEKKGIIYCCEPCAEGNPCECGCCEAVEKPQEPKK